MIWIKLTCPNNNTGYNIVKGGPEKRSAKQSTIVFQGEIEPALSSLPTH
jgi:hypothetical protein